MPVLSEIATMTEVAQGTSLARFGDGELQIRNGEDSNHQEFNDCLEDELSCVLEDSPCLVCMPHTRSLRAPYWKEFLEEYGDWILRDIWYGSSFVSRHDEVQWTTEYTTLITSLIGRPGVIIVAPDDYPKVQIAHQLVCPSENAYDKIDNLERTLTNQNPQLAILCCGPTATVLADRLARKGIWAVDLGNFAKFL